MLCFFYPKLVPQVLLKIGYTNVTQNRPTNVFKIGSRSVFKISSINVSQNWSTNAAQNWFGKRYSKLVPQTLLKIKLLVVY